MLDQVRSGPEYIAVVCFLSACAFPVGAAPASEAAERAAKAMQRGDCRAAIGLFEEALRKHGPDGRVLSSLGLCYATVGEFVKAVDRFRRAAGLEPSAPAHHYNLGLALLRVGDAENAEKAFRRVLRLSPNHQRAKVQVANALLAQALAGNASKMRLAAEAYGKAAAGDDRDPELLFNLAFTLARSGDEPGALREYEQVLRLDPDVPKARLYLGVTYFQLGRWQEAAENLRQAAARGQHDFDTRYYLGSALLKLDDREGARENLESAAALNPENPGVHFQLALLYRALGDKSRAGAEQKAFRELSAAREAKWRADVLERAAAAALQRGETAQGMSALAQAFDARPSTVAARNLAFAHLQKGNVAEARQWLQRALELDAKDVATYNYLGLLEARQGSLAAALGHFETAARLDPGFVDAVFNAGIAAFQLQKFELAASYLKQAVARADTPRTREALAVVLAESGHDEEARFHFEAAQKKQAAGR